ncbi:MAG: dodecin domain-containing protein [Dehalococcoidia bacterium]|jgi:flavin-binding protein dodecin|nr:dodecin domain-containing protein [Dehalococcoidia bacterium]
MTSKRTYKVIELVRPSSQGVRVATDGAIARASEIIHKVA